MNRKSFGWLLIRTSNFIENFFIYLVKFLDKRYYSVGNSVYPVENVIDPNPI